MNILHYSLGFPPFRIGGLTKYATDLAIEQASMGHNVGMLWPGKIGYFNKKASVKERSSVKLVHNYELINPLPVPLLNGIKDFEAYTKGMNTDVYQSFLSKIKPDVIHFHTLMGIPIEFVLAARQLKIKTIFTTHDYFGICPITTLFTGKEVCDINLDYSKRQCYICNKYAYNYYQLLVLHSAIYRNLKRSKLICFLKNIHVKKIKNQSENKLVNYNGCKWNQGEYVDLINYYYLYINSFDYIHFNSSISEMIYKKHWDILRSKVINITHNDIKDNRIIKKYGDKLKLSYLGAISEYKGYYLLEKTLNSLYENGYENFELNIYSRIDSKYKFIKEQDPYTYKDLNNVFVNTDILIVPSLWYETFGFITLEALSYGVPVIISDRVGSKDLIVNDKNGIVVKPTTKSLYDAILGIYLNRAKLEDMNQYIKSNLNITTITSHANQMERFYKMEGKNEKEN